ncbi:MAG TPA: hypothetical protein VKY19_26395 [Ktedonosporobacter sp.]|jgi:hypothetical protein|nr:hypothetical protein [Ktedonosporobacter sp.]
MHSPEPLETISHHIVPLLGVQGTILQEITLGVHHLSILSDQSIIVRCERGETEEAAQEVHLDALETYRLMQCLREVFQQAPTRS